MQTTTLIKRAQARGLYTPTQIAELEKTWFAKNDAFGLMQQAAWQMAHYLKHTFGQNQQSVLIMVGLGNNGGDGWALANFLNQLCPHWQMTVVDIAPSNTDSAKHAKQLFNGTIFDLQRFLNLQQTLSCHFDLIIDGIFGIGLNKPPTGDFAQAINWINNYKNHFTHCHIIAIDIPSGLNATTGKVYDTIAVKADITLCLIARKIGLHLQDSKDYVGNIVDLPLIPVSQDCGVFYHHQLPTLPKRTNNSHKGSYGHVLIIGGNHLNSGSNKGHGMAGASLLSASCAFAVGAGKVTVACHASFHQAIISALPNAMTADLHETASMIALIKNVDVVAIGMGLGRDKDSLNLFKTYLQTIIDEQKIAVIDADGLYHLASLPENWLCQLKQAKLYFTPHSGEASRLLACDYTQIDSDKITALRQLKAKFGGYWLIKGAQTLVFENDCIDICGLGNAGMATAGMGDCLAGVMAGLLAQRVDESMLNAVLIHAKAGDELAQQVGEYALQANDMAQVIAKVVAQITKK